MCIRDRDGVFVNKVEHTLRTGQGVLLNYANQYTKPFNDISGVMTELQNALACAQRVFCLLYTSKTKNNGPHCICSRAI